MRLGWASESSAPTFGAPLPVAAVFAAATAAGWVASLRQRLQRDRPALAVRRPVAREALRGGCGRGSGRRAGDRDRRGRRRLAAAAADEHADAHRQQQAGEAREQHGLARQRRPRGRRGRRDRGLGRRGRGAPQRRRQRAPGARPDLAALQAVALIGGQRGRACSAALGRLGRRRRAHAPLPRLTAGACRLSLAPVGSPTKKTTNDALRAGLERRHDRAPGGDDLLVAARGREDHEPLLRDRRGVLDASLRGDAVDRVAVEPDPRDPQPRSGGRRGGLRGSRRRARRPPARP